MKMDVSALIVDWGVTARVQRFSGSDNAAGKMSGSYVSVATQVVWIQPYDRRKSAGSTRSDIGLVDDTTHEMFWRFSGTAMQPEDRLIVSGQTYQYDVLSVDQPENYRHAWVKITARS
jgi:hypothetical protein